MRIALVSHEYPPFRGGGIGTYTTVMADAFARAGHEVHVVTNMSDHGSADPVHRLRDHRDGNLFVHRIPALTDGWDPRPPHDDDADLVGALHRHWSPYLYYSELVAAELDRLHADHRFDVAEFPECAAEGYGVIRRQRRRLAFADLPATVTLHSPIHEIYRYNLYSRHNAGFHRRSMMEEYTIRHATTVNSPSRLLARMVYDRLGLAPSDPPCTILPLPMDFTAVDAALAASGRPAEDPGPPTLLFVGRLEPRKGVRDLVDAAVRVMADRPDLTVDLVGRDCDAGEAPGSMTEFLKSRIPARFSGNFRFHGQVPRDELFARYARATSCVFAAPWDNFPLSCAEAMTCGACVIASDNTGMAEMIDHGLSGLLFRARDTDDLARVVRMVIGDAGLRARVRAAAPERIRALCDPARAVSDRVEHYERTVERHRALAAGRRPAPASRRPRVSVYLPNHTSAGGLGRSAECARRACDEAGADGEINLVATESWRTLPVPPAGVRGLHSGEPGEASAVRLWLRTAAEFRADYLLMLWPWDQPGEGYLPACLAELERSESTAWCTTWAMPAEGSRGVPYAGFDFSAPLEVLAYHPVPFALVRRRALEYVGGFNFDLPPGWREWDLFLAFEEAGMSGVVLPLWLARYAPREEYTLRSPGSHEALAAVLDAVTARHPRTFARCGADLWLSRLLSSVSTSSAASPEGIRPAAPAEDWWRLTKVVLKDTWPAGARAFRKYVKGQPV